MYSIAPVTDLNMWSFWELPMHIVSSFCVPLLVCVVISKVFDEPFLIDKKTRRIALQEHAWQSISGLSVWFWCNLFLNTNRTEPAMTLFECSRNLVIHYFMSDAMFYWCHRCCHFTSTYPIHRQHHHHKATKGAEMKLNALSGTCVDFWDMVIIGHLPIFIPCFFVSLPFSWMISYVLFSNFWISMIHSVGSRVDMAPSCGGFFVTPKNHAKHHMYGCKNVNFSVFTTIWDRMMGTYEES
eukprot:CAMPEP_0197629690 /NCGR_PEP_ID=MMETSP1338-20131121/7441_1 /TAXON_ID=43686 ORGANISM="Pelagodinium beii, Strain RCC1491" /NCGR_SAMPLE_ID=MMETSP1338 /ASSEMBLY_ACC=CAM_ASM_000754 /LENGTH=239 /DNA_ID=CAMNT_0043200771 /DNA_START=63 /DNA_END=782 /DNA_ORIENTATION=-